MIEFLQTSYLIPAVMVTLALVAFCVVMITAIVAGVAFTVETISNFPNPWSKND